MLFELKKKIAAVLLLNNNLKAHACVCIPASKKLLAIIMCLSQHHGTLKIVDTLQNK